MHFENTVARLIVFDIGGTWFRWGIYDQARGLVTCERVPAINYLNHPDSSPARLQTELVEFLIGKVRESRDADGGDRSMQDIGISLGAPINAHDGMVLGSGPLWGDRAEPFHLQARLSEALPDLNWHVLNDVTALLAPYMDEDGDFRKTLLVTVSSGIGSRLYDHRARRIPYDSSHGLQGEIGHLVTTFDLMGRRFKRRCECGGWNHVNAFCSGRGIAHSLRTLQALVSDPDSGQRISASEWLACDDGARLDLFEEQLAKGNPVAHELLVASVAPLARIFITGLALDPDIDRIVMTGGVVRGLEAHYREALHRALMNEGLYQITERDPEYLTRRLHWRATDDWAGLRGAGIYVLNSLRAVHAVCEPEGIYQ
jgi:glucokinase